MAAPAVSSCCHAAPEPGVAPDDRAQAWQWLRLGIAAVVASNLMIAGLGYSSAEAKPLPGTTEYRVLHSLLAGGALLVLALLGPPLLRATWRALRAGRVTVEALFTLSALGALGGSLLASVTGRGGVYYEVVPVVIAIYTAGRLIGERSRAQAQAAADKMREDFAHAFVLTCCGGRRRVPAAEVAADARVSVAPGEPVTVDGVVLEGESFCDERTLTGEPAPVRRRAGDRVLAGTWALDGSLTVRPTAAAGVRLLDGVLETVAQARLGPSRLQEQADRLMTYFLPLVLAVSLGTLGYGLWTGAGMEAVYRCMAVLLVACPCALGLATPMAVWGGLQRLARLGLVARTGEFLDVLARADALVFDKTGTLSHDELRLADFRACGDAAEARRLVGAVERAAQHPVGRALARWSHGDAGAFAVQTATLEPGRGVRATVGAPGGGAREVLIGELDLMPAGARGALAALASPPGEGAPAKRAVFAAVDGAPLGVALFDEDLRDRTETVFRELRALGLKLEILTGDRQPAWASLAGVAVSAGLAPADKEARVAARLAAGVTVVFIGDGINDAGAMARCPAAIAMGGGAALARSTASAVLMGETLAALPEAVRVCRRVRASVRGNLVFAAGYNVVGMGLAAAGLLNPVLAALLMLGSSFIVSTRALRAATA